MRNLELRAVALLLMVLIGEVHTADSAIETHNFNTEVTR
jgi:hypothetical protein